MTALLAFLRVAWPYLLAFSVGAGSTGWVVHTYESARYDKLQADDAKDKETAANNARDALQDQISERLKAEANNANVVQQLQDKVTDANADRDFARKLLAAAQADAARSRTVQKASDRQAPDGTPETPSDRPTFDLLGVTADAITECREAIQHYRALQLELAPQL